jgi:acylphosphatase
MAEGDQQRREIYYSGRVQGVGFRYTVRSLASHCAVTGFVKNLPNGRVQLVAEGTAGEIDALLAEIRSQMGDYIHNMEENSLPATGRFRGFEIRF